MTQKAMMGLLPKTTKKNFVIITNIAEGRGINGVSYKSFPSNWRFNSRSSQTKIKEYYDDMVALQYTEKDWDKCTETTSTYYIPYENIVAIQIK